MKTHKRTRLRSFQNQRWAICRAVVVITTTTSPRCPLFPGRVYNNIRNGPHWCCRLRGNWVQKTQTPKREKTVRQTHATKVHVQDHVQSEWFPKEAMWGILYVTRSSSHHFNKSSGNLGSPSRDQCRKQPEACTVCWCCPPCGTCALFDMIWCWGGRKWLKNKQLGSKFVYNTKKLVQETVWIIGNQNTLVLWGFS